MRTAEWINVCAFALFGVMAWVFPLPPLQRGRALLICNAAVLLVLSSFYLPRLMPASFATGVRDFLPALIMLLAYWTAGALVSTPSERLQRTLLDFDAWLFKSAWPKRSLLSHLLREYFEFAYLLCYPLIPAGVGVLYCYGLRQDIDDYWSLVLPSTYACYFMQPFAKALPPRLICSDPEREAGPVRRLNLLINQRASIRFITLPSAHVASTMAASLVLLWLAPSAGFVFLLLSLSIVIAAVAGRYHYALDVLLGIAVALFVTLITAPFVFT